MYQYGDPAAEYLAPTDLSFDFYPNFPNPAGLVPQLPQPRRSRAPLPPHPAPPLPAPDFSPRARRAGHEYNREWARDVYEDEPGVGFYQPPLHARFAAGVRPQLLPSTLDGPWSASDTRGLGLDAVYCGDDATIGCGDPRALAPPA